MQLMEEKAEREAEKDLHEKLQRQMLLVENMLIGENDTNTEQRMREKLRVIKEKLLNLV
jgi:hypothetical protein